MPVTLPARPGWGCVLDRGGKEAARDQVIRLRAGFCDIRGLGKEIRENRRHIRVICFMSITIAVLFVFM